MRHTHSLALIAIVFAMQPVVAQSACDLLHPFVRYVGTDAQCTDGDIQSAINSVPDTTCPKTIFVTTEQSYFAQHLTISGKTFALTGSTGACGSSGAVPTAPVVTLSGSGNGGHSVIDVGGTSNITLKYLEITGGSTGFGGGIDFNGTGSLTLDASTVDLNSADFGGGIEMFGNGGTAMLTLAANSVIESNTAGSNGGGINLVGSAQVIAAQPNTFIGFNHAPNGNGGGLAIAAPAAAWIASPGYGSLAVIYGNDALRGGGAAVLGTDGINANAYLNVYSIDPVNLVAIDDNFAAQEGGAIYLKPVQQNFSGSGAYLCAKDFHIDDNAAPEGTAIFSDNDSSIANGASGGAVILGPPGCSAPPPTPAVPCASGSRCNTLSGNAARDSLNHPTQGSVVRAPNSGGLQATRFEMRNNTGAHGFALEGVFSQLQTCLIADNSFSAETFALVDTGNGNDTTIVNCTIANNMHNSGSVFRTGQNLTIDDSIIDQPAMASVSTVNTPTIFADDVLAADPTGLPPQPNIIIGEPLFRDAAGGDYRQVASKAGNQVTASLGIDFAPPVSGDDRDLDGNPYDQDAGAVTDRFGVRDLGCYEAQPIADRVFADAFGDAISIVY